eukprot:TCALIF_03618-PA protein Name:"Similar to DDR2 Discoidin domain-containing receptor 2 (Homo sapiens)" AED:0.23 eAED:0.23 QI:0/0.5/0/0.66/1/1/3/0/434
MRHACDKPLGMENGLIGNHQIQASSSHESSSVGPNHGRLNSEVGGGAWCPKYLVHNRSEQFLEIDLEKPHRITGILTQGRYGNGLGMEFAEYYSVSFWNPSMTAFQRYADDENGTWLFMANSNTYSIATNRLAMPIVAQKLRILPFSGHPRTICMRLELLGCSVNDQGVTIDNRNARNNKTRTRSDEDLIHSSLSTEMTDGDISTNGQVTFVDQTDNLATMPWDISGLVGVVLGVAISVAVVLVGLLVIAYRRRSFPPKSGTNYASIESLTFSGGSQPSISPKEREVGSSPPFFIIQDGPIYSEPIHGNTLERTKREYFGLDSTLKPSLSSFSAHYQNLQEGTPPLEPCDRFFPDYAQDHVPENLFPQFWANTNEVPCYACTELPANLKSKAETKSLAGESGLPIYSIPETFVSSSLSTSSTTSSPFSTGRKCF